MGVDPAWRDTDLYAVLGVGPDASGPEITRAYRRLARDLHPDTSSDPDAARRFRSLSEAYAVLRDEQSRAGYDRARERGPADSGGGGRPVRVRHVDRSADITDISDASSQGGAARGDLWFDSASRQRSRVRPHGLFGRDGADLTLTLPITYTEAVLGSEVPVPTPGGEGITIRVPPGTGSGRTLRVRGHGLRAGAERGDLLVTIQIAVPDDLDAEQLDLVRRLADLDRSDPRAHLRPSW